MKLIKGALRNIYLATQLAYLNAAFAFDYKGKR
jgi:hypothetical protein